MVSSVVSTLQVEDPTRSGIVNKGPVTRSQDFTRMDDQYTFVIYRPRVDCLADLKLYPVSAFTVGDNTTALHRFVVILDPLSEQAQKYTSLFEVLLIQ
jgi:UDP-glucose:glycoprotein glucosyltransferase